MQDLRVRNRKKNIFHISQPRPRNFLKIGTCPASQKLLAYMGKKQFSL